MHEPTFAIISAVYDVARYLPDFFASLEAQTYPHDRLSVILVDDGSTDDTGTLCDAWAAGTDLDVQVIHQENAGQGSARNTGLDLVAGYEAISWLTFVDPDDFLAEDYFERLASFAVDHPSAVMLSGHQTDYFEDDPSRPDRHPLRFRYEGGDQLVDIERFPRFFQLGLAAAAVRREPFAEGGLRFDTRIRPNFEDGHLVAHYLLRQERTFVGFVASAVYWYRRRADGTSTLQGAATDPRRYTDVVEFGYLDVLRRAQALKGRVPEWLQTEIVYELAWTFRSEDAMFGGTASLDGATTSRFHELVAECREHLEDHVIEGFAHINLPTTSREAILHGLRKENWRWDSVYIHVRDADSDLVKIMYHYTGESPDEEILIRGRKVAPRYAKTRDFVYLRQSLVHERILWVSTRGDLAIRLDGQRVPLTTAWPKNPQYTVRPPQLERSRPAPGRGPSLGEKADRPRRRTKRRSEARAELDRAVRLARTAPIRRLFQDAWVLMDRRNNANDNAEHLFRYLRTHRRDVNAWFVVEKGSKDWKRLRNDGYKRLIPHGSLLWKALCLSATHIISSHADKYVFHPFDIPGGWKWSFTFLQHGVTKDDLSRWLNAKDIDLIVTSTESEHASIVGNGSGYKFSPREVAMTGMPRFDRLTELASTADDGRRRRTIMVMPTWRQYLSGGSEGGPLDEAALEGFRSSEFSTRWRELIGSPQLREAAARAGLDVVVMPHPNLEPLLDAFDIPEGTGCITYGDNNVQQVIAEAAIIITDYSSIAFDAALVGRPVVYYQFDRDRVFGGGHTVRPGYFHYGEHGFGPVSSNLDDAVQAVVQQIEVGLSVQEPYASRVEKAFTLPRTGACERTVAAIERIGYKGSRRELETPVPTPKAPPIAYDQ